MRVASIRISRGVLPISLYSNNNSSIHSSTGPSCCSDCPPIGAPTTLQAGMAWRAQPSHTRRRAAWLQCCLVFQAYFATWLCPSCSQDLPSRASSWRARTPGHNQILLTSIAPATVGCRDASNCSTSWPTFMQVVATASTATARRAQNRRGDFVSENGHGLNAPRFQ